MRYLIIVRDTAMGERRAFYTDRFDAVNNYDPDCDMIVVDGAKRLVAFDGETWNDIDFDHL